jgi:hypothetical protein
MHFRMKSPSYVSYIFGVRLHSLLLLLLFNTITYIHTHAVASHDALSHVTLS